MKTPSPLTRHLERLRKKGIPLVRWNLFVLFSTCLSLFFLNCEGKSTGKETHLVPILLASNLNTTSPVGNQGGSGSVETEVPIVVEEIPTGSAPPVLGEITYTTHNANPADDPYSTKGLLQFQKSSVRFQNPVPANTELSLYFGKKNMELHSDGTVSNALLSHKRTAANFSGYTYLTEADKKIKVFIVAKNEYGISTKQLTIGHPRNCVGTVNIPATVGDCNDHCFAVTKIGDTVEITATYNLPVDGISLHLDLVGVSPRSLPDTIAKAVNLEIPTPKIGIHTVKTSFDMYEKEYLCTKVQSVLLMDQPLRFTITQGYVNIPNE